MEPEETRALASPSQQSYNAYNLVRAGSPKGLLGTRGRPESVQGVFWRRSKMEVLVPQPVANELLVAFSAFSPASGACIGQAGSCWLCPSGCREVSTYNWL